MPFCSDDIEVNFPNVQIILGGCTNQLFRGIIKKASLNSFNKIHRKIFKLSACDFIQKDAPVQSISQWLPLCCIDR